MRKIHSSLCKRIQKEYKNTEFLKRLIEEQSKGHSSAYREEGRQGKRSLEEKEGNAECRPLYLEEEKTT